MVRLFMSIALTVFVGTLAGVMVDGWQGVSGLRTANHVMGNRKNANPRPPSKVGSRPPVAVVSFLLGLSVLWSGTPSSYAQDWDLLNGPVTLPDPFKVSFRDRQTGAERSIAFGHPQIIGAGGGGAVFSFDGSEVLLKVSWPGTAKTVLRECKTLQLLEDAGVQASERCLATLEYDQTPRSMILVTPFMKDAVSSIDDVATEEARRVAVDQIARTLVQMLSANIITIDVQPLISKATGQTIFIDMTEAQVLSSSSSSYSFLDQTLISSFVSEMVTLVPEAYWTTARTSTIEELTQLSRQEGKHDVAVKLQTLLKEQTPFFMD